jgi:hypothetical protein
MIELTNVWVDEFNRISYKVDECSGRQIFGRRVFGSTNFCCTEISSFGQFLKIISHKSTSYGPNNNTFCEFSIR